MTRAARSLHHPKSREKGDFKEDKREIELAVQQKQRSKQKSNWQDGKSETGLDEQLRQKK